MNKIFTLYTLLTLIILPTLQAQVVRYSHLQQGGAGNEKGTHMSILPSGVVLRAGTFEGSLNGYNSLGASDAMFNIEPNNGSSNINLGFGSSGVNEGLELFISGNKFLYGGSFKGVLDANQSSLSIYNLTSNSNPIIYHSLHQTIK